MIIYKFISQFLNIKGLSSYPSVIDFLFNSTIVREFILYAFYP